MADTFPRQYARTRRLTLGQPRAFGIFPDRVLFLRSLSGSDPRTDLWVLDLATGTERQVVDPAGLADDGELPAAERARRERVRETATGVVSYASDASGRIAAFPLGGHLWVADVDAGTVDRLDVADDVYDPRLDPTGSSVAYVSGRALRVVDVDGTNDREVAAESDEAVSWGRAEFVAAEEMGRTRGYWWSPDGSAMVVARVDESAVPVWWIADPAHPDKEPTAVRYPAAGADNADVSLHLIELAGTRREITWDRDAFPYLARVHWSEGHQPLVQVQSRDQRRTQVLTVDTTDGSTRLVVEDRDAVWVELFDGVPAWCGQDVVRIRDLDGARRLMVGDVPVTPDDMYVRDVAGCSEDRVVFTASTGDPSRASVYAWTRDGLQALTDGDGFSLATSVGDVTVIGSTSLDFDGFRYVVHRPGGTVDIASCSETPLVQPAVRMLRLGKRDLSAGLVLPTGHVPGTKLPVLLDPYGGPHALRAIAARRAWLESQWWADQGFAVLVADGRGTPGRDPEWERSIHLDLASPVLEDQVDALHAAAELEPDLDLTRVAIRGWSFGGFLAALAVLRRPDVFHAAIAGAPSADWAHYDTHYTERYLGRPQDNPEAYARSSLLDDAASLSRPLLLMHGLADDNVVAAHTLLFSQRLLEAGRPHSVLPLTGVTHMTPQEEVAENLLLLQLDFLRQALAN